MERKYNAELPLPRRMYARPQALYAISHRSTSPIDCTYAKPRASIAKIQNWFQIHEMMPGAFIPVALHSK